MFTIEALPSMIEVLVNLGNLTTFTHNAHCQPEGVFMRTNAEKMASVLEDVLVKNAITCPEIIEEMWQIYTVNFPPGQWLFLQEFDTREKFFRAMRSPSFLKFYAKKDGHVVSFALVTDDTHVIGQHGLYDITYLLKNVPEGKKLFWIFAFCFKGSMRFIPKEARAVAAKVFGYIFDHNGVASFDQKREGTDALVDEITRNLATLTGRTADTRELGAQVTKFVWEGQGISSPVHS